MMEMAVDPRRLAPANLGTTLGLASPLLMAAMASTPPILSGGGGIDLSVGPLMGLVNALVVQVVIGQWGVGSPFVVVPFALAVGIGSGLLNGWLAAVTRVQPIVATLGTFLVYSGLTLWIAPTPGGSIPAWLAGLAGSISWMPVACAALVWIMIMRFPYYQHLMATGGNDRAAFASGIDVPRVRLTAYVLSGLFAAAGGLALTALLGSVDPSVGPSYTLAGVAGVALGGISLAGGWGTMLGAALGASDIFLVQSILTSFNASPFALQMTYGAILVVAVAISSMLPRLRARARAQGA
jgi:ribose transport system permease protein